ncbi:hypothetical protein [Halomarina oriensis]|uniref:Uncharacterized protein n=1 Tax=Halomarina oriensis TaxID=671145 RepID=A0A6B0GSW3_9EURY|nr:hypothetical protein [Halomarina oriensis]MWG35205.1 hypothetical protein [Halomarina oriensis]
MTTDTRKLGIGVGLLAISTALVLYSALTDIHAVDALGAIAALAMAAGSLLVGLSERGAGV